MTVLTADRNAPALIGTSEPAPPAATPAPAPASTAVTYKLVVTIDRFRPEAYAAITGTLKKYYGFGKFFTWPDGIESESELKLPEESHLPWTINSMVDHIRELNAYPDPDRRIYCKITFQVIRPGSETPWQEFRY